MALRCTLITVKSRTYTRTDAIIIVILAALAFGGAVWMAVNVTKRIPHLEDEIAYIFQARVFARGALWAPPPPNSSAFFTPFVLIVNGHWVGKYPIGWPLVLALGEALRAGWLVNPVLGAATVAVTYCLGRDVEDRQVGLMAGLLAAASPFFLILAGTYMSHTSAGLFAALLLWSWRRAELARADGRTGRGWAVLGGAALGMLAITRPLTAVAVGTGFAAVTLVREVRQRRDFRAIVRDYAPLVAAAFLIALLQPLWLWLATGSPTTNLYTMVWAYDRIGFGPDVGRFGHTLPEGLGIARRDLRLWASDLYGWWGFSPVPVIAGLVFGVLRLPRGDRGWAALLAAPFVGLVVFHIAYWVGAQLYGPRYYYEAHAGLAVLAALGLREGVQFVVGSEPENPDDDTPWLTLTLLAALLALTLGWYLPQRLSDWRDVYGITPEPIEALREAAGNDDVLVIVHGSRWIEYAPFFAQNTPWLDGPVVAAHDISPQVNRTLVELFPGRSLWYYEDGELVRLPAPGDE